MERIQSGNVDASGKPMMVEARGVSKSFLLGSGPSLVPVVREVDFRARTGEFVSIVGPSGSGKSTLLYCLSGLEKPTGGDVFLQGISLTGLSKQNLSRLRRHSVGFIFQDYNLIDSLDVQANVELPLRFRKRFDRQGRKLVKEILERLGIQGLRRNYPADLSGGERQRVAIARAMVSRPPSALRRRAVRGLGFSQYPDRFRSLAGDGGQWSDRRYGDSRLGIGCEDRQGGGPAGRQSQRGRRRPQRVADPGADGRLRGLGRSSHFSGGGLN